MSNISNIFNRHNTILITSIAGILLIAILVALPTGYEDALIYKGTERAIGKVIETDNQAIISSGLVQTGEQSCSLLIMNGRYKGQTLTGVNFLSGSLEKDKIFKKGDKALLTISFDGDEIKSVVMSDHYRLNKEIILLVIFALFLILFAGKNGFQAILSFLIYRCSLPCSLCLSVPI